MAIFDLSATIAGAIILGHYIGANILLSIVIVLLFAIVVHYALDVPTRLNQYLGLTTEKKLQESRAK